MSAESIPQTTPIPSSGREGSSSNTGVEYTAGVPANIYINWDLSPEALEKQHEIEETAEDVGDTATKQIVEVKASATEDDIGDDEIPTPEEPKLEPSPPDTEAGDGSGAEEPPEPPEGPPSPPEDEDSPEDAEHSEALAERDPVRIMLPGGQIEAALDPATNKGWMIMLLRTGDKSGRKEAVVVRVTGKDDEGNFKANQHEVVDLAELAEFQIIPTAEEGKPVFSAGESVKVERSDGEVEEGFDPSTGEGWFAVTEYYKNGQRYVRVRKTTVGEHGEKTYERTDIRYEDLLELQRREDASPAPPSEGSDRTEAEARAGNNKDPTDPPTDDIPATVLATAAAAGISLTTLQNIHNILKSADWVDSLDFVLAAQQDPNLRSHIERFHGLSLPVPEKEHPISEIPLKKILEVDPDQWAPERARRQEERARALNEMLTKFGEFIPAEMPLRPDTEVPHDMFMPDDPEGAYGVWRRLKIAEYENRLRVRPGESYSEVKAVRGEIKPIGGWLPGSKKFAIRRLAKKILKTEKEESRITGRDINFGALGKGKEQLEHITHGLEKYDEAARDALRALSRKNRSTYTKDGRGTARRHLAETIVTLRQKDIAHKKGHLDPRIPRRSDKPTNS